MASNLSLSFSGGPSAFHFEGKAGYIGYTFGTLSYFEAGPDSYYELGGGTYQMIVDFGPDTQYGYNVGIEAAYEAFRHVILAFDIRWYGAPKRDLQMRLLEDDIIEPPIDEIKTRRKRASIQAGMPEHTRRTARGIRARKAGASGLTLRR